MDIKLLDTLTWINTNDDIPDEFITCLGRWDKEGNSIIDTKTFYRKTYNNENFAITDCGTLNMPLYWTYIYK